MVSIKDKMFIVQRKGVTNSNEMDTWKCLPDPNAHQKLSQNRFRKLTSC